mmetsp:Transcript_54255/g.97792  ORF Transcript_54255/g.97792 Transcript_54255/m.97792 type:complete len:227 (+) Transcript_54255:227-907(+)
MGCTGKSSASSAWKRHRHPRQLQSCRLGACALEVATTSQSSSALPQWPRQWPHTRSGSTSSRQPGRRPRPDGRELERPSPRRELPALLKKAAAGMAASSVPRPLEEVAAASPLRSQPPGTAAPGPADRSRPVPEGEAEAPPTRRAHRRSLGGTTATSMGCHPVAYLRTPALQATISAATREGRSGTGAATAGSVRARAAMRTPQDPLPMGMHPSGCFRARDDDARE